VRIHTQTLTNHTCIVCGVVFAMTVTLTNQRKKDYKSFSCPNGHSQVYIKKTTKDPAELQDEITALKAENAELKTKNTRLLARVDQLEAQLENA